MIIGLTGTNASGKGSAAKYLASGGFRKYSLSDELRSLLSKRQVPATRENLIKEGRYYRSRHGRGYLASLVSEKIRKQRQKNAVVDSIRNLGEVKELGKLKDFYLIALDAPVKVRFERAKKRGSSRDQETLQGFIDREKDELNGSGAEQQLLAVMAKADFRIIHKDNRYGNLYKKIDNILKIIGNKSNE